MKKLIVVLLIVILVIGGGIYGFYEIRDIFTKKMISQLSESEEVKKYIESQGEMLKEKISKAIEENGSIGEETIEEVYKEYTSEHDGDILVKEVEKIAKEKEQSKKNDDAKEKSDSGGNSENKNNASEEKNAGGFWNEPLVQSVYGRFSASEIASVSSMAAGGFTREEKRKVKNIVFSRVSASEVNEIINLYNKYY